MSIVHPCPLIQLFFNDNHLGHSQEWNQKNPLISIDIFNDPAKNELLG